MKLMNRNYVMVLIGQMVSIFGNAVLRFALPLYLLDVTGSAAIFGSTLAISTIPTLLFSPLGGILADRINRRNIMIYLDVVTGAIVAIAGFAMTEIIAIPLIVLLMVFFSIIQALYQPAVQASMPDIASDEHLEKANAGVSLVNAAAGILGPVVGGVVYGVFGIYQVMMIAAVCFLAAALMEVFIQLPKMEKTPSNNVFEMIKGDFDDSIHFITWEVPVIYKTLIILAALNLTLTSMFIVGMPVMIKFTLGLDSEHYGYAQGLMAVGMIIGAVMAGGISKKLGTKSIYKLLILVGIMMVPMGLAFIGGVPVMVSYVILIITSMVIMACITAFSITMLSFVQRITPSSLLGKVMAYIAVISQSSLPIGQGIYGFILDEAKNNMSLIIFVTALLVGIVVYFSSLVFRRYDFAAMRENIIVEDMI